MAASLRAILKRSLEGSQRVAVLAVGSRLRGDDAAGPLAADALEQADLPEAVRARLAVFQGETAPENLTGELRRYRPTHLVVVDAADHGRAPGHVAVIPAEQLGDGGSFSTHRMPLGVLIGYLTASLGCRVMVVGIQPESCTFGEGPTAAVRRAAKRTAAAIAWAMAVAEESAG